MAIALCSSGLLSRGGALEYTYVFENFTSCRYPNPSTSLFSLGTLIWKCFCFCFLRWALGFRPVFLLRGVGFALWVFLAPPAGRLP